MRLSSVRAVSLGIAAALVTAPGCVSLVDNVVADAISAPASEVRARSVAEPMPGDPQTLMTRLRPARAGDRARAERLARAVERGIARYRDVEDAVADGYRPFPPEPDPSMQVVHYVHTDRSRAEGERGFDPEAPGSLLYERDGRGGWRLLGAMVTAPVDATPDELDAAVPLSVTQWHLHQNVCVPRPLWDEAAWARRTPDGRPVFGPGGPTHTEAACEREGGRFLPTVFGWMAHVHPFARDPADVWNAHYGHAAGMAPAHDHGGHH